MEQQERAIVEQNLHAIAVQKHSIQQQLMEAELSLKELQHAKTAYKIVGSLMIAAESKTLVEEIERKQETAKNRLAMLETQEAKLKEKLGHGNHH